MLSMRIFTLLFSFGVRCEALSGAGVLGGAPGLDRSGDGFKVCLDFGQKRAPRLGSFIGFRVGLADHQVTVLIDAQCYTILTAGF